MSDPKAQQQEPSMEEILASIRRIIAEDERPPDSAAPGAPAEPAGEILELTEAIREDGTVEHVAPATPAAPSSEPPPADGRIEPEPPKAAVEPGPVGSHDPQPPRAEVPLDALSGFDSERILSSASSGAAAAAFARLAAVPRERRDILVGAGDRTLEDIVREALRPLLQSWLDENLPQLVERLVRAEIARVVGEAGLR